jgi:cysteine desulfurase
VKRIYLDYAATSPVNPRVVAAMEPYWTQNAGNASSLHSWGREAKKALDKSRLTVAKFLNCLPEEVIFTSCATEGNNLSLKGVIEVWRQRNLNQTPHLIVSPVEHHCVLDASKHLAKNGAEVSWLHVDKYGLVDPKEVGKLIKKNTVLVSVMYGNNEVGTVEPIVDISKIISHHPLSINHKVYFHTDAVQAIQYLNCNVKDLGVDLLSSSAHKFYGPKGVGFLYIKKGTLITGQQDGGGQEFNLRAGTENVAEIVGLAKALELAAANKSKETKRLISLRNYLAKGLLANISQCQLTGHAEKRLPHIASVVIPGAEGEAMLLHLDEKGVAASSGSACTSGTLDPSHVLLAMGIRAEVAHGSLRFSLGSATTKKDLDYLIKILPPIVKNLRKMNPLFAEV